ncbi:G2H3 [Mytilus coruscus]|uniref:HECT-type E3 ubiquitin transferase n=1 Tax=Mytilus coruscus TaxID=42192 RepID=A0A6J8CMV4_MYTCO|nr:G2H3 [Mytilus coruscus]
MQIPQADRNASMNSDQENTGSSAKPQTDITKTVQSQDIVEGDPEDTGTPTVSIYMSYVQLFETEIVTVDDSDDEGDKTIPMDGDISLPELLIKLQSQVDLEKITKFNINRNLVLDGARRAIKRKSFCAKSKISVKFTDDVGIAEGAVDEGGPKREFLRMLMKKIQYLHIFEGPENRRILAYSTSALEDNLYRDVGLFFSLSIVHGGPSPKFLSPVMYNALVGQAGERNIEDIADGDLRGEVQKVVFRKLRDGLQTLDVLTYIQEHYKAFKDLFVCQGNEKLTAEMMEVVFMDIKMSVPGSNRRRDEENIVGYWRDFLIDLQEDEDGEITLGDVLSFATGADCVPPLGFDPSPSITFLHDSGLFPKANTCSMELKLPVSEDFNTFKKNMTFGIANSPGFGLA